MRERLELGGDRRGGHLREHQPRVDATLARQERGQAAQGRIDEPIGPSLADRGQRHDGDREQVGRDGDRRTVEVAAGHDVAGVRANTIGLSVALLASTATVARTKRSASRTAPWTCAAQRSEYASWTRPQNSCDLLMPLPRISASMLRPSVTLPGKRAGVVDSGLERVDRSAEGVDRKRGHDVGGAREPLGAGERQRGTAVDGCVPLMSASPSFGPSVIGVRPAARERVAPGARAVPSASSASPSPMSTSARCASGARSPLAPTDPRDGTRGCTRAFSSATSASSVPVAGRRRIPWPARWP